MTKICIPVPSHQWVQVSWVPLCTVLTMTQSNPNTAPVTFSGYGVVSASVAGTSAGESATRVQAYLLKMALLISGWPYSFIIPYMDPIAATKARLSVRDARLLFGGLGGMNPCPYALFGPLVDVFPALLLLLVFIQFYVSNMPQSVILSLFWLDSDVCRGQIFPATQSSLHLHLELKRGRLLLSVEYSGLTLLPQPH